MEESQHKKKNCDHSSQKRDSLNISEVLNLGGDESDIALLVGMDDDDDEEIELHSDNSEGGQLHQSEMPKGVEPTPQPPTYATTCMPAIIWMNSAAKFQGALNSKSSMS